MSNVYYGDNLKPQNTQTFEAGLDVSLLNHRVGIDYTFYIINAYDQIFYVPVAPSTGYDYEYRNSGQLQTVGHEMMLKTVPVETPTFTWRSNINFTAYKNKVV